MGCKVQYKGKLIELADLIEIYADEMGLTKNQMNSMLKYSTDKGFTDTETGEVLVENLRIKRDQGQEVKPKRVDPKTKVAILFGQADTTSASSLYTSMFGEGKYQWLADLAERAGVEVELDDFGSVFTPGKFQNGKVTISPAAARYNQALGVYDAESLELTIVHEYLHGILSKLPNGEKTKLYGKLRGFFEELKKQESPGSEISRILSVIEKAGMEELITYAMTDKNFAQWLMTLESDKSVTGETLWNKLAKILAEALNYLMGNSKYDELVGILNSHVFPGNHNYETYMRKHAAPNDPVHTTYYQTTAFENILSPNQTKKLSNLGRSHILLDRTMRVKAGDNIMVTLGTSGIVQKVRIKSVEKIVMEGLDTDEQNRVVQSIDDSRNIGSFKRYYEQHGDFDKKYGGPVSEFLNNEPVMYAEIEIEDRTSTTLVDVQDSLRKHHQERGKYDRVFDEIATTVSTEIEKITAVRSQTDAQKKRLARLREIFRNVTGWIDLEQTVNLIHEDLKYAAEIMKEIQDNPDNLEERELISLLHDFGSIANNYEPIFKELGDAEDIQVLLKEAGLSVGTDGMENAHSIAAKLKDSLALVNSIKKSYYNNGRDMMSKYLIKFVSDEGQVEANAYVKRRVDAWEKIVGDAATPEKRAELEKALQKRIRQWQRVQLTQAKLKDALYHLDQDTSWHRQLLGEAIQSTDPALALFFKDFTYELELARKRLIQDGNELQTMFSDFIDGTKRALNNPEVLYEGLYETVSDRYNGYQDRLSFVQPFELNQYNKNLQELYESITDADSKKDMAIAIREFHEANSQQIPQDEIDSQIATVKKSFEDGTIGEDDYNSWINSHMSPKMAKEKGFPVKRGFHVTDKAYYKGRFLMPSEKYRNPKWSAMYDLKGKEWVPKNAQGKFHKELTAKYFELQNRLPDTQEYRPGYFTPSVKRRGLELFIEESAKSNSFTGMKEMLSESYREKFQIDNDETQYGVMGGKEEIPIYMTRIADSPDDVSRDLGYAVAQFAAMVRTYEARTKVLPSAIVLNDLLQERTVASTVGGRTGVLNRFAAHLGYRKDVPKLKHEDRAYKQFHTLTRMMIFGEERKPVEVNVPFTDKTIYMDKVVDLFLGWTAFSSLGFSAIKAATNWASAKVQNLYDVQISDKIPNDVSAGAFFEAEKIWIANLKDLMVTDRRKVGNKSRIVQIIDRFGFQQDHFFNSFGKRFTKSDTRNFLEMGVAFFGMHMGEVQVAATHGFARLIDKKVMKGNKEISLMDALIMKDGKLIVDPEVKWDSKMEQQLINEIHGSLRQNQGNYGHKSTGVMASQSMGGRAVLFFRNYLYTGIDRRMSEPRLDHETGLPHEGIYWSTMEFFQREYRKHGLKIQQWDTLDDFEKKNVYKSLAELTYVTGMVIMATALAAIANNMDIDDDDVGSFGWFYWHALYLQNRVKQEAETFINPFEYIRVLGSPVIAFNHVKKMSKLLESAIPISSDGLGWARYKQDQGPWKKGTLKLVAHGGKVFGYTGETLNPKMAKKNYDTATN